MNLHRFPSIYMQIGWALSVLVLVIFFLEHVGGYDIQADDAYISYRYAENLVLGHGLVFNPGEHVEGFTNLLWTLLVALGAYCGLEPDMAGFILAIVCSVLLLVGTQVYAYLLLPKQFLGLSIAAPVILLASNAFTHWSTAGLETPLFAALFIYALIASLMNKRKTLVVLCLLSMLTRPDGVLLAAVTLGLPLLQKMWQKQSLSLRWPEMQACVVFLMGVICLTLFRLYYYGDVVPNTFYAKVGGIPMISGILYVMLFLFDGAIFLILPAVFALFFEPRVRTGSLLIFVVLMYSLAVGGDVFSDSRFLLPALAPLIGIALCGIGQAMLRFGRWGFLSLLLIPASIAWYIYGPPLHVFSIRPDFKSITFPHSYKRELAIKQRTDQTRAEAKEYADHIRAQVGDDALVAAIGIGRFGYFSQLRIIDLVGLVDKTIAKSTNQVQGLKMPGHQRTNADYVLSRSPDIILIPKKESFKGFSLPAMSELWLHPDFDKKYRWDEKGKFYALRRG